MKFDSIGFDLDGTLWSSIKGITEAWDIIAKKFNVTLPSEKDMEGVMGLNRIDLMTKLFPDMDYDDKMKFFEEATVECDRILKENGGELYDNLEETLKKLSAQTKLYIVSNCQEGYIENFLNVHKLGQYFTDYECAGTKDCTKGALIKDVLERNGWKKSIYLGDTQGDRNAAKEAEIPFIFASYGFGEVDSCEYSISEFSEMLEFIC